MDTTQKTLSILRSAGLSQSEISRRTGIPQPRLSRWESGSIPTAADDAIRLLRLADEIKRPDQRIDVSGGITPAAAPAAPSPRQSPAEQT